MEDRLMNEFKFAPSPADEPTGTYLAQIRCVLAIEAGQEYALPRGRAPAIPIGNDEFR
jgi:hypothetical protein